MAQGRRQILLLLSATVSLCAALPPWYAAAGREITRASAGASRARLGHLLRATLSDPEAASTVGGRYLAGDAGAEAEALELADRLLAGRPAEPADLRRLLSRHRNEDTRRRSFVVVDGWVLPKAEAQACALTMLL